ncbi:MAG: thioredoxin domain-containing protein [Gammaproteobacteria bacterium]
MSSTTNTSAWIFDVTLADFGQQVLAPVLERVVTQRAGTVWLARVEVDDNMKLAGRYRVRGFPTVILFADGEELGRFSGARPAGAVDRFLAAHLDARGATG